MAKNRSRRLRKKMHIEEFQEVGFSVAWRFPEGTSVEQIDQDVDAFINEVIEPNKLALKTTNWKMSASANFSTFGGTNKEVRGQH